MLCDGMCLCNSHSSSTSAGNIAWPEKSENFKPCSVAGEHTLAYFPLSTLMLRRSKYRTCLCFSSIQYRHLPDSFSHTFGKAASTRDSEESKRGRGKDHNSVTLALVSIQLTKLRIRVIHIQVHLNVNDVDACCTVILISLEEVLEVEQTL